MSAHRAIGGEQVLNRSPFVTESMPFPGPRSGISVIVKGSFRFDPQGSLQPLQPSLPLAVADDSKGDPTGNAAPYESDLVPFKPRADVLCVGSAYPNRGKPGPNCLVAFGVGQWLKQIVVVGDRSWK